MLRNFAKEKYDIIVLAGQSNAAGSGIGPAEDPYMPTDDIWFLNEDFTISIAREYVWENETVGNFALSFARKYVEEGRLKEGRKVLIIRSAVGGTGFLDKHWGLTDDLFLRMMDLIKAALELNPENRLVAFLWHQGETDAGLNASRELHYNNLLNLICAVRDTFGCKALPFIAGDFVEQWKNDNIDICRPVIDAIKDVCANIGHAAFVETDGLKSNDQMLGNQDTIHFCRDALNKLGLRYYDAFCRIIDR
ncbi:MAG TPA: sialate O-acetylesterase [Candidatus Atribacteria bacterium]|nr:sialate O-acetylesterase [Candidatus Atribacteria bacterium]